MRISDWSSDVCSSDLPKLDKLTLRRKVGMVFQQYNLFPHKTALENVMMAPIKVLKEDRRQVEERARALIRKVRLEGKESSYPGELSCGQQQRVANARSQIGRATCRERVCRSV